MKQKDVANNFKSGFVIYAVLFVVVVILGLIFPSLMTYFTSSPFRLFGWGLIVAGIYSFIKREGYSIKPSWDSLLMGKNPFMVFGLPDKSFLRHYGWGFQLWCVMVVIIGIVMVIYE